MEGFVRGDVVVVPFPFSNLSSAKRRPALVLTNHIGEDMMLCQITSQSILNDLAVEIGLNDIKNGTLSSISNARPDKLFTADKSIILYKVGELKDEKIEAVINTIIKLLTE